MDYPLWEGGAPLFDASFNQPQPTLTAYPVPTNPSEKPGCVIVCPGGAYVMRADHEGKPISEMLNAAGIYSFVLNYRVSPYRYPAELFDVTRAVRWVRYNAGRFGYDPNRIAVLGFSAGGHLAMMSVTQFASPDVFAEGYGKKDAVDEVSSRPDAGVLCYAVITLGEHTNACTRDSLLGARPDPKLIYSLSGENAVRDDMPPIFMWHTASDGAVPIINPLKFSEALDAHHIPFELHVFPYGDHGLGLASGVPHVAQWAPLLVKWLKLYKY